MRPSAGEKDRERRLGVFQLFTALEQATLKLSGLK